MMSRNPGNSWLPGKVWLFGQKTGFDSGMVAEMGMQSLVSVAADRKRIRLAEEIKGISGDNAALYRQGLP